MSVVGGRMMGTTADFLPELRLGLDNLRAHKLRSLLTMLGMIFGVAAVVAMLSIGAGAQQEVTAFIEQLGVRNLIVEAREAWEARVDRFGAVVDHGPERIPAPPLPAVRLTPRRRRA